MKITQHIIDSLPEVKFADHTFTLKQMLKQNLIMQKALEFYADRRNAYEKSKDNGKIAYEALKELEGGNNNLRNRSAHVLGSWQY